MEEISLFDLKGSKSSGFGRTRSSARQGKGRVLSEVGKLSKLKLGYLREQHWALSAHNSEEMEDVGTAMQL